jgi:hypothetical protein
MWLAEEETWAARHDATERRPRTPTNLGSIFPAFFSPPVVSASLKPLRKITAEIEVAHG